MTDSIVIGLYLDISNLTWLCINSSQNVLKELDRLVEMTEMTSEMTGTILSIAIIKL